MKKIALTLFLIINNLNSQIYNMNVITKNIEDKHLTVRIKNNSKKTLLLYSGLFETNFKIIDNDGKENIGEVTSIYSGEDSLDYQFDYSKSLINKTMKKYSLSFREAILYLHYKNKYILIPSKCTKDIDLPIITNSNTMEYKLDSTKSYFLSASTTFSAEYIPQYVKDSLMSENIEIITPKINFCKINVNINKFFRKYKDHYIK
ncbi:MULTISPECIES: hypothetical protein [unclassified Chryseobacterium]|uniref:hypothetical protein n=1 Tax=unclassified Chryseobacterium TaxID=2593645 RepID=UPI002269C857|nr:MULTISPECIES: hypothetical protein [unclassified Chryseobacterium]